MTDWLLTASERPMAGPFFSKFSESAEGENAHAEDTICHKRKTG